MASSARIDELRKKFDENPRRYFAPLANEYRKAGEIEQAISICREYLPQQPGHMSGHIVYGQALFEARQFEEAKTVFETALSLDPENLIALRHLGDIALVLADSEGARSWYRRVLEADPRNEDIQAQLAKLDRAASEAPTPAVGGNAVATEPTSSSAATVVMAAVPRPEMAAPAPPAPSAPSAPPAPAVTATSPTAEIVLDDVAPGAPATAATTPVAADIPLDLPDSSPAPSDKPEAPAFEIAPTAISDADTGAQAPPTGAIEGLESTSAAGDAAPVDSFSLDGLETTSMGGEAPIVPAAPDAPDIPLSAGNPPAEEALDLDLGALDATPPAPNEGASSPAAAAAPLDIEIPAEAPPPPAPAADIPSLDFDVPAVREPEPAPAAPAMALDLPATEAPEPQSQPQAESAAPEPPPMEFLDLGGPSSQPTSDAGAPVAGAPSASEAPETGDPFATETMAELYLRQGHRDEALRVYKALLAQRPGDAGLAARIRGLETPSGPTIRELLTAIAERRPGFRSALPAPLAANGTSHAAAAMSEATSATTDATTSVHAESAVVPAMESGHADALAMAFDFPPPASGDERAAQALARAFSANGQANGGALSGRAAHVAPSELSLDSVFGGQPPEAPPAKNFSFDQFFSQRAAAESAGGAGEPARSGSAAESQADVAQFTQWLEGLKRR